VFQQRTVAIKVSTIETMLIVWLLYPERKEKMQLGGLVYP